jgi:hypothetical protein
MRERFVTNLLLVGVARLTTDHMPDGVLRCRARTGPKLEICRADRTCCRSAPRFAPFGRQAVWIRFVDRLATFVAEPESSV